MEQKLFQSGAEFYVKGGHLFQSGTIISKWGISFKLIVLNGRGSKGTPTKHQKYLKPRNLCTVDPYGFVPTI